MLQIKHGERVQNVTNANDVVATVALVCYISDVVQPEVMPVTICIESFISSRLSVDDAGITTVDGLCYEPVWVTTPYVTSSTLDAVVVCIIIDAGHATSSEASISIVPRVLIAVDNDADVNDREDFQQQVMLNAIVVTIREESVVVEVVDYVILVNFTMVYAPD